MEPNWQFDHIDPLLANPLNDVLAGLRAQCPVVHSTKHDGFTAVRVNWSQFPTGGSIMGIIIWLIVGGIVGWLASIIMKRDAQQGIILNIVVGIVGALLGGFLLTPFIGGGSITNGISAGSLIVSFLGALILLAIVNLVRRGSVR